MYVLWLWGCVPTLWKVINGGVGINVFGWQILKFLLTGGSNYHILLRGNKRLWVAKKQKNANVHPPSITFHRVHAHCTKTFKWYTCTHCPCLDKATECLQPVYIWGKSVCRRRHEAPSSLFGSQHPSRGLGGGAPRNFLKNIVKIAVFAVWCNLSNENSWNIDKDHYKKRAKTLYSDHYNSLYIII